MAGLYPHKFYFEPVALIDQNIVLVEERERRPFRVLFLEPLQPTIKDFGSIGAASPPVPAVLKDKELDVLKFANNELGQLRHAPLDPVYYELLEPAGVARFVAKGEVTRVGPEVWRLDPHLQRTEIYRYQDTSIKLNIYNMKRYGLAKTRIIFYGYRFILEPLPTIPDVYTAVPIKGWVRA